MYVLPSVGGEERKLFDVRYIRDLKWSPDGKWLVMSLKKNKPDPVVLWRYTLDGNERQQLTFPPPGFEGDSVPTYSPDGKLIDFVRNYTSGGSDIFIIPADGGEPRRITYDAQHIHEMTFTSDGEEIVF